MTTIPQNTSTRQPGQSMFSGLQPMGDMTKPEALTAVKTIKDKLETVSRNLGDVRRLAVTLKERKGWIALGYDSWRECAQAEFGESMAQVYRQLDAGLVEQNISPMGEISGDIPERWTRELRSLPPIEQKAVYDFAVATAPEGEVTARWIKSTRTVYEQAKATGGFVDIGDGESTAMEAAITKEAHETMLRQKQHVADGLQKKPNLFNETVYVEDIHDHLITFHFDTLPSNVGLGEIMQLIGRTKTAS